MSETTVAEKVQNNASVNDPSAVALMQKLMGQPDKERQLIGANNPQPAPQATPAAPAQPALQTPAQSQAQTTPQTPPAPATQVASTTLTTPLGELEINKGNAQPVNIANFEDAFKYPAVVSAIGMEVKTPQEFFEKVLPNLEKWRAADAKVGELETKNKNLIESVKILPAELKGAINTYYEDVKAGTENWKSLFNNAPVLNFKDPVEKVSEETLINTYFPGKFTSEELADPNNQAVQIAKESSKQTYTTQRQSRIEAANRKVREAQLHEEAVSASIESSIQKFGDGLPIKPDAGRKGQVEQMMRDGTWVSAFLNEDGTFKPDASTKIGMALHGTETFQAVISSITNQVQSKANEAAVDKADVTKVTGAGSVMQAQDQQAQMGIKALVDLMKGEKTHF